MFTCDDGSEIGFTSVNDGESSCSDGSDEAPTDGSTKMFTCNDGSEVEWTTLNDGYGDCPTLEDEGVLNHYTLQMNVFDDAGTPLSSITPTDYRTLARTGKGDLPSYPFVPNNTPTLWAGSLQNPKFGIRSASLIPIFHQAALKKSENALSDICRTKQQTPVLSILHNMQC